MNPDSLSRITDEEIRSLFSSQNARHTEVTAAIHGENISGYPTWAMNLMEHRELERLAARMGIKDPDYKNDQIRVYRAAQTAFGANVCDQWIPDNPMEMGDHGYEGGAFSATTGNAIVVDGMTIEEPEDVVEHMERFLFPALEKDIAEFDEEARIREIGLTEYKCQQEMGLEILKTGYEYITFPTFYYGVYGYENYFCAYQLYEDVIDRHFALQAELCRKNNEAAAKAIERYDLPRLYRLDHDITDSRSPLVDVRSMDRIWFPRVSYSLAPILEKTDTRLIWHCDGNIMPMVPRLLDIGIRGFQGFQYECGVDFAVLAKMRDREGQPLFFEAGASVTTTLPHGTPEDVKRELQYFAEVHGDSVLTFGSSSSIAPGVPPGNLDMLIEGLAYYRTHKA